MGRFLFEFLDLLSVQEKLTAAQWFVVLAVPVVRLVASMYADPGPDAPFTMAASPMLTRVVAGACCAAGVLATVLAQPLLLLAQGAAGPIH